MSSHQTNDTIAAIATPPGEGAIAIVRMSGPGAREILTACFAPRTPFPKEGPKSHRLYLGALLDGQNQPVDQVMAVYMRGPKSYTAEDVCEIHCHGGRIAPVQALNRVLELGARPAQAGEFTRRAFENGRISLNQAEAVMQMISAGSRAAARAAAREMEGGASRFVSRAQACIQEMLSEVAAATDFPEEVEESEAAQDLLGRVEQLMEEMRRRADPKTARLISDGAAVALAGRPNVGKSSLMNAILDSERAIVADQAGTTRDVLTERLMLDGLEIRLSDTAGQRDTQNEIERMGVERARRTQHQADVVVLVLDGSQKLTEDDRALLRDVDERYIIAVNKSDLRAVWSPDELGLKGTPVICISARTGLGMEELTGAIRKQVQAGDRSEEYLTVQRHVALCRQALEALEGCAQVMRQGLPLDLCAAGLWEAAEKLGEITGDSVTGQVIDQVFQRFCVGK